jgi:NADH-quinone oxidoreductase subunit E
MATARPELQAIVGRHGTQAGALIPILQDVQEEYGYLSADNLKAIAAALKLPSSKVFGVVTFYSQFHQKPRGRHVIRVCLGTACHVRGGETLLDTVSKQLGIGPGETTADLNFTLERVACLGACGLAPALMVNDTTYGRLTPRRVERLINNLRRKDG